MIRWALNLSEFNIEWELRPGVQNVVADVFSRNPIGNLDGSQISCAALRALALNSREQREDPDKGRIEALTMGSPPTKTIVITAEIESGFVTKDNLVLFRRSPVSSCAASLQTEASMGGRQGQHT
ncbi:hypothetical protein TNCV_3835741 [Trichonephila clavipes]|nr:hypothetical protein TNCV_3835741 [Trichonephila clavipes]